MPCGVPAGEVTIAVITTPSPNFDGFGDVTTVVVVAAGVTVTEATAEVRTGEVAIAGVDGRQTVRARRRAPTSSTSRRQPQACLSRSRSHRRRM